MQEAEIQQKNQDIDCYIKSWFNITSIGLVYIVLE